MATDCGEVGGSVTQTHKSVKLAVVIPMYNPGSLICQVLERMPKVVDLVIVVDDGCTDGSPELVRQFSDPRVRMVVMEKNSGVGAATWRGMEEAVQLGADVLVKVDADMQMDPRLVPQIASPVLRGQADFAKGNRFLHTEELVQMPLLRRVGNMILSFLTKAATGYWHVFDPTNGFFVMRSEVFPLLNRGRIARDYFFEISLLAELGLHRCAVQDVPQPASYPHQLSHLSLGRVLLTFPSQLGRAFLRRLWFQHFVQDFGPVAVCLLLGLGLFLGGALFGAYHWALSLKKGVAAPTGTIMLAVLPMVFGFQLLLQALLLDMQATPRTPIYRHIATQAEEDHVR